MSDDSSWLLLLGPTGAAALYWALYRYYRNTDKSHAFEHETEIKAEPVTGSNTKVGSITRTRESHISGDNVQAYRQRVKRIRPSKSS